MTTPNHLAPTSPLPRPNPGGDLRNRPRPSPPSPTGGEVELEPNTTTPETPTSSPQGRAQTTLLNDPTPDPDKTFHLHCCTRDEIAVCGRKFNDPTKGLAHVPDHLNCIVCSHLTNDANLAPIMACPDPCPGLADLLEAGRG